MFVPESLVPTATVAIQQAEKSDQWTQGHHMEVIGVGRVELSCPLVAALCDWG